MSTSSILEIVELPSGEIVLRRSTDDETNPEPLVRISFSGEAKDILGDMLPEIGRAMISTGIEMVGAMYDQDVYTEEQSPATLH